MTTRAISSLRLTLLLDASGVSTLGMIAARAARKPSARASSAAGFLVLTVVGAAGLALAMRAVRLAGAYERDHDRQRESEPKSQHEPQHEREGRRDHEAERDPTHAAPPDHRRLEIARRLILLGAAINTVGSVAGAARYGRIPSVLGAAAALLVGGDVLSAAYYRALVRLERQLTSGPEPADTRRSDGAGPG